MHIEKDASGRVRKLGEGGFGQVQASRCCDSEIGLLLGTGPCRKSTWAQPGARAQSVSM